MDNRCRPEFPPVLRQLTVVFSTHLAAISVGGAVTYPTLLMESFRTNGTTADLDVDTKSWIGSIYGLAGIPAMLMPIITQKIGRKCGYIITCLFLVMGWILACGASTITQLLVSESFHGLATNSLLPIAFLGITEMISPKYRAYSLQIFGIALSIGMALCGILGRYFSYDVVGVIMLMPIGVATVIALMWPESPSWFAYRGQFSKCERAFVKLRGTDDLSKQELSELITAQRENINYKQNESMTLKTFWKKNSSRDFCLPCFHTFILFMALYWSGCDVIYINFIDIVTKSTNIADVAIYAGIAMYLIIVCGITIRTLLIIKFKNKPILIFSTCCVIVCLLAASLISALQYLGLLAERSLLLLYCLIAYTAFASIGLNGLVFSIASEVMPVKHRSLGGALSILFNCVLYASSLKLSPYITLHMGLWCTFLIYAVNGTVCIWYIWKYVPETSGRSLQEIEDFYVFGDFTKRRVENGSDIAHKLVTIDSSNPINL